MNNYFWYIIGAVFKIPKCNVFLVFKVTLHNWSSHGNISDYNKGCSFAQNSLSLGLGELIGGKVTLLPVTGLELDILFLASRCVYSKVAMGAGADYAEYCDPIMGVVEL